MRKKTEVSLWVKMRAVVLFLMIVCVGTGIVLLFTPIFDVKEVYCEGNQRIAAEEIVGAAEVQIGKSIFTQRLSKIKKRVAEFPMVEEVRVRRVFPNKIKIWIQERIPAAYLYSDQKCVVIDMTGEVLEIIDDARVSRMLETYTPKKVAAPKPEDAEKTEKERLEKAESKPSETVKPSEGPEDGQGVTSEEDLLLEKAYPVPLVVGLPLEKAEVGKKVSSKEKEKLRRVMEAFTALEEAELLVRSTYLDVNDLANVTLVIENRLEVQLGALENVAYRFQFLGTVIREKISAAEHAVLDYQGDHLYVRAPEDGKQRMIPRPTETPEPSEEEEGKDAEKPTESSKPEPSKTPDLTDMA